VDLKTLKTRAMPFRLSLTDKCLSLILIVNNTVSYHPFSPPAIFHFILGKKEMEWIYSPTLKSIKGSAEIQ
jgi:hypothetical protein